MADPQASVEGVVIDSSADLLARAFAAGVTAGHYRILGFIGAGGMGEVYRAHDTRLGRDVALKILPSTYGGDPERIRRFTQEARTMLRINHPNVVSIFDAGDHEGRPYIVSELLEGETLRDLLEREPQLAVRKVIEFAIQIARGLAAAHDKGVVHRDLKPANIFIAADGHVKILDFGLAKLVHPQWDRQAADSDTISAVSLPGTVLGSVGYMSPEQVEARPLDSRSDVFALGAILYEMLTGRRAFRGSSKPAAMSAILKDDPRDILEIRANVSPALVTIVRRCLEKRKEDRFQSARDLAFNLEELTTRSDVSFSAAALGAIRVAAARIEPKRAVVISLLLLATAIAVLFVTLGPRPGSASQPLAGARLEINRITTNGSTETVALSPDGKYAAYASDGLWLLHIPTQSSTRLLKDDVELAQFSPDGNYIYFTKMDDGYVDLYRMPILGGDPQRVAQKLAAGQITFTRDGGRLAFLRMEENAAQKNALVVATATGSNETTLCVPRQGTDFASCAWAPDATRIVCAGVGPKHDGPSMFEVDAATGAQRDLPNMSGLQAAVWMPDGSALVGSAPRMSGGPSQLWRVAYPDGKSEQLTDDLSEYFLPTISADGNLIAAVRIDSTINLWAMDLGDEGSLRQITQGVNTSDGNFGVRTLRDRRILWASGASGKSIDLWIGEGDGLNRKRLTFDDGAGEKWFDLAPDEKSVVYVRDTTGTARGDVYRLALDGSQPVRLTSTGDAGLPHFVADGRRVVFTRTGSDEAQKRLFEIPVTGGEPRLLDERNASGAVPSSDGKWLLVNAPGPPPHIELRNAASGQTVRTYPGFGLTKRWRPDGLAFAFIRAGNIWEQDLAGSPQRQLTHLKSGEIVAWGFDWSRDGRKLVFARRTQMRDAVVLKLSK